jgi:hypothetical protein
MEFYQNPSPGVFRKCCVSNDINGTKIVLWEEDHEEFSSSDDSIDHD